MVRRNYLAYFRVKPKPGRNYLVFVAFDFFDCKNVTPSSNYCISLPVTDSKNVIEVDLLTLLFHSRAGVLGYSSKIVRTNVKSDIRCLEKNKKFKTGKHNNLLWPAMLDCFI